MKFITEPVNLGDALVDFFFKSLGGDNKDNQRWRRTVLGVESKFEI